MIAGLALFVATTFFWSAIHVATEMEPGFWRGFAVSALLSIALWATRVFVRGDL